MPETPLLSFIFLPGDHGETVADTLHKLQALDTKVEILAFTSPNVFFTTSLPIHPIEAPGEMDFAHAIIAACQHSHGHFLFFLPPGSKIGHGLANAISALQPSHPHVMYGRAAFCDLDGQAIGIDHYARGQKRLDIFNSWRCPPAAEITIWPRREMQSAIQSIGKLSNGWWNYQLACYLSLKFPIRTSNEYFSVIPLVETSPIWAQFSSPDSGLDVSRSFGAKLPLLLGLLFHLQQYFRGFLPARSKGHLRKAHHLILQRKTFSAFIQVALAWINSPKLTNYSFIFPQVRDHFRRGRMARML